MTRLAQGRPRWPLGRVGAVLLALVLVVAAGADVLAPFDPSARVGLPFAPPGGEHLLGTDDVGHDLLSLLVHGTRVTLLVGFVAATVATVVGSVVGLVAGYLGGWIDIVLMRLVDVVLSLPFLPLMIVVGVFLGPGIGTQILVISSVMWAGAARELRAQVLSVREREHVLSARSMGAGPVHALVHHVGPVVTPLVVPQFVLAAKRAILFEAALSFLGLGSTGVPSWGTILFTAHARSAFLTDAWLWWVVPPGLAIALVVVALAFIGTGVEERARPRLRQRDVDGSNRSSDAPSERDEDRAVVASMDAGAPPSGPSGATTANESTPAPPLLAVDGLTLAWASRDGAVVAVDDVSLTIGRGEVVGLVGESGAGKSSLAMATLGLLPPGARVRAGTVRLDDVELLQAPAPVRRDLLGRRIALVPQDAMNALNPVMTVGSQVAEAITLHGHDTRREVTARVRELFDRVGVDAGRLRDHPHQFSGGMRQRVVIAMALANDPDLVVADEPTSGLDVVVQAEIVALLERLKADLGLAMLVVSHDLPLVLRLADRLAVMRHGRLVEQGPTDTVVRRPEHPHTRALVDAVPRLQVAGRTR